MSGPLPSTLTTARALAITALVGSAGRVQNQKNSGSALAARSVASHTAARARREKTMDWFTSQLTPPRAEQAAAKAAEEEAAKKVHTEIRNEAIQQIFQMTFLKCSGNNLESIM